MNVPYCCVRAFQALPSNGYTRTHIGKNFLRHRFYCCVSVLRALPRNRYTLLLVAYLFTQSFPSNGSTCHNINSLEMLWRSLYRMSHVGNRFRLGASVTECQQVPSASDAAVRTRHSPCHNSGFITCSYHPSFNASLSLLLQPDFAACMQECAILI
jgi:hypothetical protein